MYVYRITNNINGKKYIGITNNYKNAGQMKKAYQKMRKDNKLSKRQYINMEQRILILRLFVGDYQ